MAAAEGRSLHLTCGLKPTTGADLLAWLADQLRASATVRANLPHFASREEQVAHLAALLKEFTSALHDGVIEEFLCARGAMDPVGRCRLCRSSAVSPPTNISRSASPPQVRGTRWTAKVEW